MGHRTWLIISTHTAGDVITETRAACHVTVKCRSADGSLLWGLFYVHKQTCNRFWLLLLLLLYIAPCWSEQNDWLELMHCGLPWSQERTWGRQSFMAVGLRLNRFRRMSHVDDHAETQLRCMGFFCSSHRGVPCMMQQLTLLNTFQRKRRRMNASCFSSDFKTSWGQRWKPAKKPHITTSWTTTDFVRVCLF